MKGNRVRGISFRLSVYIVATVLAPASLAAQKDVQIAPVNRDVLTIAPVRLKLPSNFYLKEVISCADNVTLSSSSPPRGWEPMFRSVTYRQGYAAIPRTGPLAGKLVCSWPDAYSTEKKDKYTNAYFIHRTPPTDNPFCRIDRFKRHEFECRPENDFVNHYAQIELVPSFRADLDSDRDERRVAARPDIWWRADSATQQFLDGLGPTDFVFVRTPNVTLASCNAALRGATIKTIPIRSLTHGRKFCFTTSRFRVGWAEVVGMSGGKPATLTLKVTTFAN